MSDSDKIWFEDQERHGWTMPTAPWWKRLPIIRHVRAAVLRAKVYRWASEWGRAGIGFGRPQQYDLWVCYGIAKGRERPSS